MCVEDPSVSQGCRAQDFVAFFDGHRISLKTNNVSDALEYRRQCEHECLLMHAYITHLSACIEIQQALLDISQSGMEEAKARYTPLRLRSKAASYLRVLKTLSSASHTSQAPHLSCMCRIQHHVDKLTVIIIAIARLCTAMQQRPRQQNHGLHCAAWSSIYSDETCCSPSPKTVFQVSNRIIAPSSRPSLAL